MGVKGNKAAPEFLNPAPRPPRIIRLQQTEFFSIFFSAMQIANSRQLPASQQHGKSKGTQHQRQRILNQTRLVSESSFLWWIREIKLPLKSFLKLHWSNRPTHNRGGLHRREGRGCSVLWFCAAFSYTKRARLRTASCSNF